MIQVVEKAAWVHLDEGRLLTARTHGRDRFYLPGGTPEPGETPRLRTRDVCSGTLDLDNAVFEVPVTVEAAACVVTCRRTRWATVARLSLRYAQLDLSSAVLEFPLTVTARPIPFLVHPGDFPVLEEVLDDDLDPGVQLMGLDGTDAALVVLLGIDLSLCEFAGAVHLDQLRVDGWCTFATTPSGGLLRWWTRRSVLVEEHHWRSVNARHPAGAGWTPGLGALPPATLAALYRQLRKSLEDGKNEPDAADFYYGEMEMHRHDTQRPRGEVGCTAVVVGYGAVGLCGVIAAKEGAPTGSPP
ncbi:hypothetical protein GCM10010345_89450 [Streptomyces canarius]|uniref:Uncharacterized protein n=1 Tax=Streptomyces canarius TaxID=285453 RepID=A0ABQ3DB63_9ACTN|nr:hypothetical protein GCM10010345_89450 [Streptomyces canarius]